MVGQIFETMRDSNDDWKAMRIFNDIQSNSPKDYLDGRPAIRLYCTELPDTPEKIKTLNNLIMSEISDGAHIAGWKNNA